jgi:hypothetical protein
MGSGGFLGVKRGRGVTLTIYPTEIWRLNSVAGQIFFAFTVAKYVRHSEEIGESELVFIVKSEE